MAEHREDLRPALSATVHIVPVDDLIEHETEGESCVCGPTVEWIQGKDGNGWVITHHALDGRQRTITSEEALFLDDDA